MVFPSFCRSPCGESGASFNEERAEPDRSPPWLAAIRGISDMNPPTPSAEEEEHLFVHIIHN